MKTTALVWFKNDLRTLDNGSLTQAMRDHHNVLALYCFDPRQFVNNQFGFKKTEKYRAQFLIESIQDLKKQLERLHIPFFIYFGTPEKHIPELISKYDIAAIYSQKEWTKEEADCSVCVKNQLSEKVSWISSYDKFLFHPDDILMSIDQIPTVFSNFRKYCEK